MDHMWLTLLKTKEIQLRRLLPFLLPSWCVTNANVQFLLCLPPLRNGRIVRWFSSYLEISTGAVERALSRFVKSNFFSSVQLAAELAFVFGRILPSSKAVHAIPSSCQARLACHTACGGIPVILSLCSFLPAKLRLVPLLDINDRR